MLRILFVCTGNTCRSPMAAALFNRRARERGIDAEAGSAGVAAQPGAPASANAVLACAREGIDLSGHRARQLTPALVERADRIYGMSEAHRALLEARFPAARGKTRVLGGGIPDPFGGDEGVYRLCLTAIGRAVGPLLDAAAGAGDGGAKEDGGDG